MSVSVSMSVSVYKNKHTQVKQLEARLSTFSPLVQALSREVALALDSAADALNSLGAEEKGN